MLHVAKMINDRIPVMPTDEILGRLFLALAFSMPKWFVFSNCSIECQLVL
jgi:hypothetical protein